jgi:hypothetical protein
MAWCNFTHMTFDKYPVSIGASSMVYEFVSEGVHGKIPKLVVYSETHLQNFYNLGFGDKNESTGLINDHVISNNGDSEKVLATVTSTVYLFTDKYPGAMVFATGSSRARTRLYRIGISNNLELIQADFEVFGLAGEHWEDFKKGREYDAFLVIRKNK